MTTCKRLAFRCPGVALACLLLAAWAGTAAAQSYPPGLSDAARAKFEVYDARIAAAIQDSKASGTAPRDLPTAFPKDYALAILREVFGADWAAIREFADAALAALPRVEPPAQLAAEPVRLREAGDGERKLFDSLAAAPAFEDGLATARMWDPEIAAAAAASAILALTSAEEVAHHAVTSGFASRRLVRSTWRDRDALILFEGGWVFAFTYVRTPRGLIVASDLGLYER